MIQPTELFIFSKERVKFYNKFRMDEKLGSGLTGKWDKVQRGYLSKGVAFASTFFRVLVKSLRESY